MATFTQEEWDRRRRFIGASEVPALLGVDPFATLGSVVTRKLMEIKQGDGNAATDFGHDLEDGLVRCVERKYNVALPHRQIWKEAPNGVMSCTLDGADDDKRPTVAAEAKTTGIYSADASMTKAWGKSGTDEAPLKVIYQSWAQMICCPTIERVIAVALIGGRPGPQFYEILRDDDALDQLETIVLEAHEKYIISREPVPDDAVADLETLSRITREQGKSVTFGTPADDRLFMDTYNAVEKRKAAEKEEDRLSAILRAKLGDAEIGEFPSGRYSYKEESAGKRIDVDALRSAHPDIYEEFAHPGTRMMPRFKLNKKKEA